MIWVGPKKKKLHVDCRQFRSHEHDISIAYKHIKDAESKNCVNFSASKMWSTFNAITYYKE